MTNFVYLSRYQDNQDIIQFWRFSVVLCGEKSSKTTNNASYFLALSPNTQCLNTNIVLKFEVGPIEIRLENAGARNSPYTSMRRCLLVTILKNPLICTYEQIPVR